MYDNPMYEAQNTRRGERVDAYRFQQQARALQLAQQARLEAMPMNFDDFLEESNAYVNEQQL